MPKTKKIIKKDEAEKKTATRKGLTIPVYDLNGKVAGTHKVAKEIFSADVNRNLLAQYVRVYLANQRRATASTKTRSEVKGSTRKIYRQKGTGRARHGDIKAPVFVGGGVVGGPTPRDYSLKMNKEQAKKALFAALTLKLKEKNIIALNDQFLSMKPKTKIMNNFLKSVNLTKSSILLVVPNVGKNSLLYSSRNLSRITSVEANSINAYQILRNSNLLIVESALSLFEKRFLKHEN